VGFVELGGEENPEAKSSGIAAWICAVPSQATKKMRKA
jgi:hypothetical protein